MTAPRQVLAGTTYLLSRRCFDRQFLLKPSPLTDATFKFALAVAAERHGILLHAVCVLSNHVHVVLTDPDTHLPRFCQLLHGLVARALNASYGRWESFWAPGSYSAVALEKPADALDKAAYTLTNPVTPGLVAHGSEWPGVWSDPQRIGGPAEIVKRPGRFFSEDGTMPEEAALVFTPPPGFASAEEFRAALELRIDALELEAAAKLASQGRRFMGARRILRQKHTDRPAPGEPRRVLNPRIAARDKWKRIEAIGRLVGFLRRYREALVQFRSGLTSVVFPRGTYLLRVQFGVACASA